MANEYFKRTKKKLVGSPTVAKELMTNGKFSHFMHKFDGTHAELIIGHDDVRYITRDGNDVSHLVPHLIKQIEEWEYRVAYVGVYACELVHLDVVRTNPKDSWSASRRVLGCKEYNPDEPPIDCIIYDVHEREYVQSLASKRSDYHMRRVTLPKFIVGDSPADTFAHQCISLPNLYVPTLHSIGELERSWYNCVIGMKTEGMVLCDLYKAVKWEDTFTKMKPLIDIDCVVMGYNMGKVGGKFEGMVGSIDVGVFKGDTLVNIGKLPHMEDSDRYVWTRRMQEGLIFNNKGEQYVIQAECAEITSGMKMRFPNYVRERTGEKLASECTWEQLL